MGVVAAVKHVKIKLHYQGKNNAPLLKSALHFLTLPLNIRAQVLNLCKRKLGNGIKQTTRV